jgi:sodium/proline symporter
MFLGLIGWTFTDGISASWLMVGWIGGDWIAFLFVHRRLRAESARIGATSIPGFIAGGGHNRAIAILAGLITLIFLSIYASAQLVAGGKALHAVAGWSPNVGVVIGALIVAAYCFSGGIRASIWTDAAQSAVMVVSMAVMVWFGVEKLGGWTAFAGALENVSPHYMDWFPERLAFAGAGGPLLFILGWLFAGFAVVGQPHIMVRFMAMDNPDHMFKVRMYYYGWFTAFYALTISAGLASRLLLPRAADFDAELALPTMAGQLLPDAATGLVLAGLFAATISTADSQILSCTAAITRDFPATRLRGYMATKLATVFVTALALVIALGRNESVFQLVLIAWSALASAFGPLAIVYSLDQKPSERLAIAMMAVGIAVVLGWRQLGWDQTVIYEIMPGMLSGLLVFAIGKSLGMSKSVRA